MALTGPVPGDLVRAGLVPVHFAPAQPLLGDPARAGSLPAHCVWAGPCGAFARSGQVLVHLAWPVLGQLVRPVSFPWLPKPRIVSTRLQMETHYFLSDPYPRVQQPQQIRRGSACRLQSAAKPERRRLIELLASADQCEAEAPTRRRAKPRGPQGALPDFLLTGSRYRSLSPL